MEPSDLLKRLADALDRLGIAYLVTGSMASIAYGEPRFTNDIDVVANSGAERVDDLRAAFPAPEFYCSADAARQAVQRRSQFNILHPESGLKVDVIVAADSEFDRSRFGRARRIATADTIVAFASPEDVILEKLQYFRAGGSEKHLRDIVGILKVQADAIDQAYLADWLARFGLVPEWQLVLSRLPRQDGGQA